MKIETENYTVADVREQFTLGVEYYAQQAHKPAWYDLIDEAGGIAVSATAGSSPWNEWAGFKNRRQALDWFARLATSQSFVDNFTEVDGDFYSEDDVEWDEETYEASVKPGAKPADLADMFAAQSRF